MREKTVLVLRTILLTAVLCGCGGSGEDVHHTRITIDSAPEQGAEVMVGGYVVGVTPVVLEGVAPGRVDVLLKMDRYKRVADRIEVKEGAIATFVIEMEPVVGYVTIESEPRGAEVLLDDAGAVGKTPLLRWPMQVGDHHYELRLPNHYGVGEDIEVKQDYQYSHKHVLKPMEATLTVLSRPTGADIYLNNQVQMDKTPARFTLSPGWYIVSVYTSGYVQKEEKVRLAASDDKTVSLKMDEGQVPLGMVLIPAGEFVQGASGRAPDEVPQRKVMIPAYYIDKLEVTNVEYRKAAPGHSYPEGQDNYPATGISWNEAREFAAAVQKRLPTEAEWEKAARGADGREFPWGEDFNAELCNTEEADVRSTARAGSYLGGASPYGCMDMTGNVYEWTQDWYNPYPGNDVITKDYGQIYRVLRGGSYDTEKFDGRCARRYFDRMDASRPDYGFRCAKDVE